MGMLLLVTVLLITGTAAQTENKESNAAARALIPKIGTEVSTLSFKYGSTAVTPGAKLALKDVEPEPVDFKLSKSGTFYVFLLDVDARNSTVPKFSPYLHWLSLYCGENKKKDIVSYEAPLPPDDSGEHRLVMIAYTNTSFTPDLKIKIDRSLYSGNFRRSFDYLKLIEEYKIDKLFSANYYVVEAKKTT